MSQYRLRPITLKEANDFVDQHHRHNKHTAGHKFSIGLEDKDGNLVGVAICGRPVARYLDDGKTIEVNRVCVLPETSNGNSMLYGASFRASIAMGYKRVVTYILLSEGGASLKASGFVLDGITKAHKNGWDTKSRHRDVQEICTIQKQRWIKEVKD